MADTQSTNIQSEPPELTFMTGTSVTGIFEGVFKIMLFAHMVGLCKTHHMMSLCIGQLLKLLMVSSVNNFWVKEFGGEDWRFSEFQNTWMGPCPKRPDSRQAVELGHAWKPCELLPL